MQLDLFEIPMKINQANNKKLPHVFRKSKKCIETLFFQLFDQFMIRINYAKYFLAFKTIVLAKITALTLV